MLGKLLKHEWLSTWKLPTGISVFLVIMTVLGCLSFQSPMWENIGSNSPLPFSIWDIVSTLVLFTYFLSIIVCAFIIFIYFGIRFYRNFFTGEGYLMHTLPTTPSQLILSKWIINFFWQIIGSLLVFGSMCVLMYSFISPILSAADKAEIAEVIRQGMPLVREAFQTHLGISLNGFVLSFILISVLGSISSIGVIYLSISIGQLFRKHKVAAAIITYMVILSIIQVIASIGSLSISFKMVLGAEIILYSSPLDYLFDSLRSFSSLYILTGVTSAILSVVSFFVIRYLIKEKLNLD